MAPPKILTSKGAIEARLPDLRKGPYSTKSNALHPKWFVASLSPWANFKQAVEDICQTTNWAAHQSVVAHEPLGFMRHHISREQIFVGDETGVQGRFNQHVGQVITAACGAFGMDMIFGDHKACFGGGIEGIPDSVVMSILGVPRLIGEIKVDWVAAHHIQKFDIGSDEKRQRFVGQIGRYMREGHLRFGFLSTYEWTIFLRQVDLGGEQWGLEYSPAISHKARAEGGNGGVSVRQAFWFVLNEASGGNHVAMNNMPMANWVVDRCP